MDEQKDETIDTAIFAGGCFWCTEAVFQRLNGVLKVESGYTGGHIKNPAYREVCSGRTGHAEGVRIEFDTTKISYTELMEVFFATHDPTTLNRQGNDVGTQYRSEIFYTSEQQQEAAEKFLSLLRAEKVFAKPIVTALSPAVHFYEAENDHQNYFNDNRMQPYCQFIIDPKVKKLQKQFSEKLNTVKK